MIVYYAKYNQNELLLFVSGSIIIIREGHKKRSREYIEGRRRRRRRRRREREREKEKERGRLVYIVSKQRDHRGVYRGEEEKERERDCSLFFNLIGTYLSMFRLDAPVILGWSTQPKHQKISSNQIEEKRTVIIIIHQCSSTDKCHYSMYNNNIFY